MDASSNQPSGGISFSPFQNGSGGLHFDLPLASIQAFQNNAFDFLAQGNQTNQGFLNNVINTANTNLTNTIAQQNAITSVVNQNSYSVAQAGLTLAKDVSSANNALLTAINNNIFTAAQYAQQQETQRAQAQASAASGGLCFITTACCDAAGLPDDCDILTAMRAFRDDVMMGDPLMRELVELYYEKAAELVAFFMYNVSDARAFWKSVKSFWIDPIYSSLMYGDYETAVNKYLDRKSVV